MKVDCHENAHKAVDGLRLSTRSAPDLPFGLVSSLCGDMPHNTVQKIQPTCHWAPQLGYPVVYKLAHAHLARVFSVILHPHVSPPETIFVHVNTCSMVMSHQTPPRTSRCIGWLRSLPLCKNGIHPCPCPAWCTYSDGIDVPILLNECGHLQGVNAFFFWWCDLQM